MRLDIEGTPSDDVGAAMGRLARALQDRHGSVPDTLQEIVSAAVANVPAAQSAGVSAAAGRDRIESTATTDELPRRVAELQTRVAEGPCLESLRELQPVGSDDLRTESRWPAFTAGMTELPVRSMLSLPLYVSDGGIGSLSLYAAEPDAFDERSREICLVFASHAAVALAAAQKEEGLLLALDSRDVIGQAKGILMERYRIGGQQAFLLLVRLSQHHNVKLRDLAAELVTTGTLDTAAGPPAEKAT